MKTTYTYGFRIGLLCLFVFALLLTYRLSVKLDQLAARLTVQEGMLLNVRLENTELAKKLANERPLKVLDEGENANLFKNYERLLKLVLSQEQQLNIFQEKFQVQEHYQTIPAIDESDVDFELQVDEMYRESERKLLTWHEQLRTRFESEIADDHWANEVHSGLQSSLDVLSQEFTDVDVQLVDCRSSMCKVTVKVSDNSLDTSMFKFNLSASLPKTLSKSTTVTEKGLDGNKQYTYYFWN